MMKFELDVVRFNIADVITTSDSVVECADPGLPVSWGGNAPDEECPNNLG